MLDWKKFGKILAITFLVVAGYTFWCCTSERITNYTFRNAGLDVFYYLENVGMSLPNYIFITFMATNMYLIQWFKERKNNTVHLFIERKGFKKVFVENIKNIVITSTLFRLVCFMAMLIVISIICHGIHFDFSQETEWTNWQFFFYSNHAFSSFLIYIFIATVGYVIFCLFLYGLGYWIKNEYVYRATGVLTGILGQTGLAIIAAILGTNATGFLDYLIVNTVFVGNLLCPGSCEIGSKPEQLSYYVPIGLALLFFGIITFRLLKYIYKKEYREGID